MKKIIFILLFFPIMYLYAQENIVFYTDNFGFHKYTITKDKIIFEDEDRQISEEYNRNDFKLAENGFYYLFGKIVIFQKNGFCYHPQIDFVNEEDTIRYKKLVVLRNVCRHKEAPGVYVKEDGGEYLPMPAEFL